MNRKTTYVFTVACVMLLASCKDKKKAEIYQTKRQELAQEERKLMEPLFKEINLAMRTVANQKKLTVVMDKGVVFYGGTDITDAVIAELKKTSK